jgi:hypothetical protein
MNMTESGSIQKFLCFLLDHNMMETKSVSTEYRAIHKCLRCKRLYTKNYFHGVWEEVDG